MALVLVLLVVLGVGAVAAVALSPPRRARLLARRAGWRAGLQRPELADAVAGTGWAWRVGLERRGVSVRQAAVVTSPLRTSGAGGAAAFIARLETIDSAEDLDPPDPARPKPGRRKRRKPRQAHVVGAVAELHRQVEPSVVVSSSPPVRDDWQTALLRAAGLEPSHPDADPGYGPWSPWVDPGDDDTPAPERVAGDRAVRAALDASGRSADLVELRGGRLVVLRRTGRLGVDRAWRGAVGLADGLTSAMRRADQHAEGG